MNTTDGDHILNGWNRIDILKDWNPFKRSNAQTNWIYHCISIGGPIVILGGAIANILPLVVLIRHRLWLKHEGYVYLAANFCVNFGKLLFFKSSLWITTISGFPYNYPPSTSNFMCKFWHFMETIFFAYGWLSVAILFSVHLREHLTQRRWCGCPMFAAKYCTLFASKIVVGVIFGVSFIFGLVNVVRYDIRPKGGCHESDFRIWLFANFVEAIVMWFLPFVFLLPIILLVTLCTKREGNVFRFSQIEERSDSDEQMRVMAVTLSSMILFSQYAFLFLHISLFLFETQNEFIILMEGLSIAVQPILCFVILKELREEFLSQLRSIHCCRPRSQQLLDCDEEAVQMTEPET